MELINERKFSCILEEWECPACGFKGIIDDVDPVRTQINFCPNCGHNENDNLYFFRPNLSGLEQLQDMFWLGNDKVVALLIKKNDE